MEGVVAGSVQPEVGVSSRKRTYPLAGKGKAEGDEDAGGVSGRQRTLPLAAELVFGGGGGVVVGGGKKKAASGKKASAKKKARVEVKEFRAAEEEKKEVKENCVYGMDISDWTGAGGGGLPEGIGELGGASAGPGPASAFGWDGKNGLSQFRSLSLGLRTHADHPLPHPTASKTTGGGKEEEAGGGQMPPFSPSDMLDCAAAADHVEKEGDVSLAQHGDLESRREGGGCAEFSLAAMHTAALEDEGAAAALEDIRRMHSQSGSDSMGGLPSPSAQVRSAAISFPSLSTSLLGNFDADIVTSARRLASPASASTSASGLSAEMADRCLRNDNALDAFAMEGVEEQRNCPPAAQPVAGPSGGGKDEENDREESAGGGVTNALSVDLNLSLTFAGALPDFGLSRSLVLPNMESLPDASPGTGGGPTN